MKSDRQSKRKVEDPLSWCLATDISDEVPNRTTGPFTRDRGVAARPASLDACWSSCALRVMCTFKNPRQIDQRNSDSVIHPTRLIKQGEAIYRANEAFRGLYAVRTGSFKTIVIHRDGRTQITGFQLPGEAIGLDGVGSSCHKLSAIAMQDSTVCIAPFSTLDSPCYETKAVQRRMLKMMSGEIARESMQMMLLGTMTAEQRVAAFLLDLSKRLTTPGVSPAQFNLPMTREEIGSYLGLQVETVSRMFSRFHRDCLLDAHGKQINSLNLDGLSRL